MRLSKTELGVLGQIAQGAKRTAVIAAALKKSRAQIYRCGQKLVQKRLITRSEGVYTPAKTPSANLLLRLLGESPGLTDALADSGLKLLTSLLAPKTIPELISELKIGRTRLFKKIKQARRISLVRRRGRKYALNRRLWAGAIDFLRELKVDEETTDARIPANSTIYYKDEEGIVFSTNEELDAAPTAFSAYAGYGIKILSPKRYYFLPKKHLAKKEVFKHSLYVAEKEPDIRHITFVALFYAKFRKSLRGVRHWMINNVDKMLKGEHIPEYPSLAEIKERAELYDIRL